jgi:hypothetical protein
MRVIVALLTAVVALSSETPDADGSLQSKPRAFQSAIVEFTYERKSGTQIAAGSGKLLFAGDKYRLNRYEAGAENILADNGSELWLWWQNPGQTMRVVKQPDRIRREFQRDVMVYLASLLFVDSPVLTYRSLPDGALEVRSTLGDVAQLQIRNGRVEEVKYSRLSSPRQTIDIAGRISSGAPNQESVLVYPSDFRTVDGHALPHRLRFEYRPGESESLSVQRYNLNSAIPASDFEAPRGK